jgi:hypothetical protein
VSSDVGDGFSDVGTFHPGRSGLLASVSDELIEVFHGRWGNALEDDHIIIADYYEGITSFKPEPFSDFLWYDDLSFR